MNEKVKAMHEKVAEKLIEQLQDGTAPWQVPWDAASPQFGLPYNAVTDKRYRGINIFSLLNSGFEDMRWMTFNQALANDMHVKKGEKATMVQYVKTTDLIPKKDDKGNLVVGENGKPEKVMVRLDRPMITTAWVFNAAQIDGIEKLGKVAQPESKWTPVERAEFLVNSSGADVLHKKGESPYYSPLTDRIVMPSRSQFATADRYYATLLHELGHWTGHPTRLDRDMVNKFGTPEYAREELRAEIASMLLGHELKIGHDPGQHAAYVADWIQLLKDHPFEIHSAAADAEKIVSHLLAFEQKREVSAEVGQGGLEKKGKGYLTLGDEIAYNNTIYKVTSNLKGGKVRVEDSMTGTELVVGRKDGLYNSLLDAKASSGNNALSRTIETTEAYSTTSGPKR